MALNNTYDAYDARPVQQETAVGAGAQILLLSLLGTAIGMGTAGWLTGLAFAFATWAVLSGPCTAPGCRRSARPTGSPSAGPPWSAGSRPWSRTPSAARRRSPCWSA